MTDPSDVYYDSEEFRAAQNDEWSLEEAAMQYEEPWQAPTPIPPGGVYLECDQ